MKHAAHIAFIGDLTMDKYINSGEIRLGGAALNGAIWARKLGAKSSVITSIGTDSAGKEMIKKLKKEHISKTHLQIRHGTTSSIEIFLDADGEKRYGVWDPGVLTGFHFREKDITYLRSMDAIVAMGYPQFVHILQELAAVKRTRDQTPFVVINYGDLKEFGRDLQIPLQHGGIADLLVFSLDTDTDAALIEALKTFAGQRGKMILITCGSEGSVVYDGVQKFTEPAEPVVVVDSTGAGDAFLSAFLVSYLSSKDIQKSLIAGTDLASKVIQHVGAY